jgi:hypothetical protein
MIENSNISANSYPKLKTLPVVSQDLRCVLLAKQVKRKISVTFAGENAKHYSELVERKPHLVFWLTINFLKVYC